MAEQLQRPGLYVSPDPDRNTVYTTGVHIQRVTDTGRFLFVEDPQFGSFTIGGEREHDRFLYEMLTTPGMDRSQGVSQLCKDESSATIANTALLTRYWHMLGVSHANETLAQRQGLPHDVRKAIHLRGSFDDSAHRKFSHATELFLQGWGGKENLHELDWPEYAHHGGQRAVIEKFGVAVNAMLQSTVEVPAWVNSSAPELNPDRFQYGVTELLLWFDHDGAPIEIRDFIRTICSLDNLVIDDQNHLAFQDKDIALLFAKGYLLLSTEHWNEPINRIQLHLLTQAAQRIILERRLPWMDAVDRGETRLPDWYFYGIDQDVVDAIDENHGHSDSMLFAVQGALIPIATAERRRFSRFKMREYADWLLDEKAHDYPSEHLTPKRVEFGTAHPSVVISMKEATPEELKAGQKMPVLTTRRDCIEYKLLPLKNRYIDPRVITKQGSVRLSEIDPAFKSLLEEQQQLQHMTTHVQLVFAREFRGQFVRGVRENETRFAELRNRQPFTDDQKRRVIEMAANRAVAQAMKSGRFIRN